MLRQSLWLLRGFVALAPPLILGVSIIKKVIIDLPYLFMILSSGYCYVFLLLFYASVLFLYFSLHDASSFYLEIRHLNRVDFFADASTKV